jgi:hypothetical protein
MKRLMRGASTLKSKKNGLRIKTSTSSLLLRSQVTNFSFQLLVTNSNKSLGEEKHSGCCDVGNFITGVGVAGDGNGLKDRND